MDKEKIHINVHNHHIPGIKKVLDPDEVNIFLFMLKHI